MTLPTLLDYLLCLMLVRRKKVMYSTQTSTTDFIYNFAFSLTSSWTFALLYAVARSLSTLLKILPLADFGMDLV